MKKRTDKKIKLIRFLNRISFGLLKKYIKREYNSTWDNIGRTQKDIYNNSVYYGKIYNNSYQHKIDILKIYFLEIKLNFYILILNEI